MKEIAAPEIVPATVDRWSAVSELLDASGKQGCWCQAWRGRDATARASAGLPRLLVRLDL